MGRAENPRAKARWRLLSKSLLGGARVKKRPSTGDDCAQVETKRRSKCCWDPTEGSSFRFPCFGVISAEEGARQEEDGTKWFNVALRENAKVAFKVSRGRLVSFEESF